jgi:hypothetical protein
MLPARIERDLRELALPGRAIKTFPRAARAERTRQAYSRAWAGFDVWCRQNGRRALPASPETVAGLDDCPGDRWRAPASTRRYLP